jgi:hypothetical protein
MVVAELDVICVAVYEAKADPPLIVYRDRMLVISISCQRMEPVTRWNPEVIKTRGQVDILELSSGPLRDVSRDTPALAGGVDLLSATVCERLYHWMIVTRHVTHGKRPDLSRTKTEATLRRWSESSGAAAPSRRGAGDRRAPGRRARAYRDVLTACPKGFDGSGPSAPCDSGRALKLQGHARMRRPVGSTSAPSLRTAARRSPMSSTANPCVSTATALST